MPQPEGPIRAVIRLRGMRRLTPASACLRAVVDRDVVGVEDGLEPLRLPRRRPGGRASGPLWIRTRSGSRSAPRPGRPVERSLRVIFRLLRASSARAPRLANMMKREQDEAGAPGPGEAFGVRFFGEL